MAFRQPTFQAPQRVYSAPQEVEAQTTTSQTKQHNIAESQEWILFSPSAASTTNSGYTNSTTRTRTAGHSRISDFGSLDSAARSYDYEEGSENAIDEEDGELDSLDSHLHEFRAEPSVYRESQRGEASGTVLPTHDGLGSFRIDRTAMGNDVQEHLYAFERYNPRRVKRRRESLEVGILEEGERAAEAERTRRIEMWRMEQSRLLVDEIQKETRRRKESMSSERRKPLEDKDEDAATLSHVDEGADEESDNFWSRITKRVIRDLMGIDDDLLAIIFGESLPGDDLSTTPLASHSIIQTKKYDESSWELRLLQRVAQELGILVSQISDHPGAFSTYLHSQETPLPYAGLPVIPESRDHILESSTQTSPQFHPTIQTPTSAIPIPTTSLATLSPILDSDATPRASNLLSPPMTREEWESDLDIKMVFRYLRSRFTSKFKTQSDAPAFSVQDFTTSSSGTAHLATASTADTAARAARVRQHHPLITRQTSSTAERRRSIERRTWRASVPGGASPGAVGLSGGVGVVMGIRRGSSSCASERLSLNGRGVRSGSSRHYWDFGGQSVGSGSLLASTGGMGSWGEV
ncbi:uncharacterized protein RAG0_16686 [Rhynchosporium agropyri]|uniref:Uncharacterized protein n=1 Tax=Rhynchosporium agropyri TaxID=914238 RepID=A0A1E1LRH0_9HELO|nr:uncharacterized protein RAG0_16686 [Rhynchosporium agropyri]